MNRTDRLYAIREALRRAGSAGRTAEELARTFEVSTRTVKRDVAALQQAGFPVWARLGRVGGYVVDAEATMPPVTLTASEVSGLAAAVIAHRGLPFDAAARAALDKILGVLDGASRRRATELASRIWIDRPDEPVATPARRAVDRALAESRVVGIRGLDDRGARVERDVDPIVLAWTRGAWYLVGHARQTERIEWYPLESLDSAVVRAEPRRDIPVERVGTPPPTAASLELG